MLPAFLNPSAGSAEKLRGVLEGETGLALREVAPEKLGEAIKQAVEEGAARVVVTGGDGTIATAAAALAGSSTELAIIPGGTLNHFAKDLGIPTEPDEAIRVALSGEARGVDLARVNDRVFLNTSSVGAYVRFVKRRERLERYFGYRLASLIAAFSTVSVLRPFRVQLEVDGERRVYATPIVFVGVGERELQIPMLGGRIENGRAGLHVLIPRAGSGWRLALIGFRSLVSGVRNVSATPDLDSFVVRECTVEMRRPHGNVAVDGELVAMRSPLTYRIDGEALRVVMPASSVSGAE